MELFSLFKPKKQKPIETFTDDYADSVDASAVVSDLGGAQVYSMTEYDSSNKSDNELIELYRRMSISPEIDLGITEIKNESFVFDDLSRKAVEINLDGSDLSKGLQNKIKEEFDTIYNLLDFDYKGLDYFSDWYIDGRIIFHIVVDSNSLNKGIQRVVQIDPRKLKKVIEKPKRSADGKYDLSKEKTFYLYTEHHDTTTGMKISPDAIVFVSSGLKDRTTNQVISYLHKAIVPYNNLRLMEDSLIIYRVTRAPERRVFYVDTGNLPKTKAEQYIKSLMQKFKNKLVYDSTTGDVTDRKNVLSMVEDYWLPRREGGRGTEVSTLPGGQSVGITEDIDYFKNKLIAALNVPVSRFRDEGNSMFSRGAEITRDEYRFRRYIERLRYRFSQALKELLKKQLILKKIISENDWELIENHLKWDFTEDNTFTEMKDQEIISSRLQNLQQIADYAGKYFTDEWIMKNVLRYTEDQIESVMKMREENPEPKEDDY